MDTQTAPSGLDRTTRDYPATPAPVDPVADARTLMAVPAETVLGLFDRTVERWGLDRARKLALLGRCSPATYARWKRDPAKATIDLGTRERIGHVLGIQANLVALFGPGEAADGWVLRPNTGHAFGGVAPIVHLTSGLTSALSEVRLGLARELAR